MIERSLPLYFVSLPTGPLMARGKLKGKVQMLLPLFGGENQEMAQAWVEQHPQHRDAIGVVPIRSFSELKTVLLKAKQSGCRYVAWNRHPDATGAEYQTIASLLSWLPIDLESN